VKSKKAISLLICMLCLLSIAVFADKDANANLRILIGQVMNSDTNAPLPEAVVYLKNNSTQSVHTYIADKDGNYRFTNLSANVDYQVYADYKGHKSDPKTLSQFDSRKSPTINLRVDLRR
jgi:Carboxypeptidase regulatory-like domain